MLTEISCPFTPNDVDTPETDVEQSIPQIINSVITMVATLITMIVLNPALTVISILTAVVMLIVTSNFSKLSGKYYVRQQMDLGAVDGFIGRDAGWTEGGESFLS